jgi:polysaccharide deacetylase family protein (PEP-CTERM system associated)
VAGFSRTVITVRLKADTTYVYKMPPNIITVDLEEWFHVCGVGGALAPANWDRLPSRVEQTTRIVLDLLDGVQVRATFFVVGWVCERYPRLIETVLKAGHEVGSHGYCHARVYDLGRDRFRQDLCASFRALAAAGAGRVTMFRAPEWSITDRSFWALQTLVEEGVTVDASMAPTRIVGAVTNPRHPHLRHTPAGLITEVPPLVVDRFGQVMPMGWGWGLRMSSPRRVVRAIEAVNRAGVPAVLTVHPWELDPNPPRTRLPARLQFAHYFRLSGFRERLRAILHAAPFSCIGDMTSGSCHSDPDGDSHHLQPHDPRFRV